MKLDEKLAELGYIYKAELKYDDVLLKFYEKDTSFYTFTVVLADNKVCKNRCSMKIKDELYYDAIYNQYEQNKAFIREFIGNIKDLECYEEQNN